MLTPTPVCSSCSRSCRRSRSRPGARSRSASGIDARTVRRYVAALQALDIPVEGQRGVGGGYRIRPGYRLPPLMLNDDEAVAVVLGLIGARGSALGSGDEPVDGALAKILRVLPAQLRTPGRGARADARLHGARRPAARPSAAAWRCCWPTPSGAGGASRTAYRSFSGEPSRRELSPLGLVVHAGRWYLAAHDHGRDDLRTFRVDRMTRRGRGRRGGDRAAGRLRRRAPREPLARPRALDWEVEVLLDLPVDEAAGRLPPTLAELAQAGDQTLLRMRVSTLEWMAGVLAGLGCAFTIRRPDELRASVQALSRATRSLRVGLPRFPSARSRSGLALQA